MAVNTCKSHRHRKRQPGPDFSLVQEALRRLGCDLRADQVVRVVEFARALAAENELAGAVSRAKHHLPPATARAIRATENAVRAIEAEFGLLSSTEVAQVLGSSSTAPSLAHKKRASGELIYLRRLNRFVYPGFQFSGGGVKPAIKPLLQLAQNAGWTPDDVSCGYARPRHVFLVRGGRSTVWMTSIAC